MSNLSRNTIQYGVEGTNKLFAYDLGMMSG